MPVLFAFMDPATLYILVKLADDREHVYRRHLTTMAGCKTLEVRVMERKPDGMKILNSACWPLGADPPDWTNLPIIGVPVDPRHFR
jgi:hypothetical protein